MSTSINLGRKPDIFDRIENFFYGIDRWLRGFSHRREMKKIKTGLESNPALFIKTKEKFEEAFGVNAATRSPAQWRRLVQVYGIDQVCKIEKKTESEIRLAMEEKFAKKLKSRLN